MNLRMTVSSRCCWHHSGVSGSSRDRHRTTNNVSSPVSRVGREFRNSNDCFRPRRFYSSRFVNGPSVEPHSFSTPLSGRNYGTSCLGLEEKHFCRLHTVQMSTVVLRLLLQLPAVHWSLILKKLFRETHALSWSFYSYALLRRKSPVEYN